MNLQEYREFVRSQALRSEGDAFFNSSIDHASVVVENLFSIAKKEISILSGSFNPRVYGREDIIREARFFLAMSSNNRLRIILESDSEPDRTVHPFFKACCEFSNLELKVAPPELQERYNFHFIVVDDRSFRYENNEDKPAAIAVFGDREIGEQLGKMYSDLWDQSGEPRSIKPI